MSSNQAMRRLAVTTGFELEAEVPGHFRLDGDEICGLVLYGRLRENKHHSAWDRMWSETFW